MSGPDLMHSVPVREPSVSVVVPLYDGGRYIESTLNSIFRQSFNSYEVLVVDDGSTDDGPAKVSAFVKNHPERIRLLRHADNGNHGIAASRNLAIRSARGTYIAFIDQDDVWMPGKLELQVRTLQRYPEAALVYAKADFIDQEGKAVKLRGGYATYGKGAGRPQNVFNDLINEDFIPNLTVVVRKSCLERVGLLDEGPRYAYEDWLLLSKLAFFYDFIFIPEVLAQWRLHGDNYSARIFSTGQFTDAEEDCTISLFSFLMKEPGVAFDRIRKQLDRRIWRLLMRARSWGVPVHALQERAANLERAFPSERRIIHLALRTTALLHPSVASLLRRIRRMVVGV